MQHGELKCSEEIFNKISRMKNSTAIIAAKFNDLKFTQEPYMVDGWGDINNKYKLVDEFFFKGECVDLIEISIFEI